MIRIALFLVPLIFGFQESLAQTASSKLLGINGYWSKSGIAAAVGETHTFKIFIADVSSTPACVMYAESQSYTFTTQGYFSLQIGNSTSTALSVGAAQTANSLTSIFDPTKAIATYGSPGSSLPSLPATNCQVTGAATNSPAPVWGIYLSVDGSLLSGTIPLTAHAMAMSANNALVATRSPVSGFYLPDSNSTGNLLNIKYTGSTASTLNFPTSTTTSGNLLSTDGTGNLSWVAPSAGTGNVSSGVANGLAYYPSTSATVSPLATAVNGVLTTNASGVPSITSSLPTPVLTGISSLTGLSSIGTITTGTWNASPIGVAYGGTGTTSLTANGLLMGNGSGAVTAIAPGALNYVLTSNGVGTAPTWQSLGANFLPTAGGTMTGQLAAFAGSASTPGLGFASDTSTGIYKSSAGVLGFAASGTSLGTWSNATGLALAGPLFITPATLPASPTIGTIAMDSSSNTLKFYGGSGWVSAGATGSFLPLTGGTLTGNLISALGSSASPGIGFATDTTTGFYQGGSGVLGFAGSGSSLGTWSSSGGLTLSGSQPFTTGTGAIALNGPTSISANQNFAMTSGSGQFTQTYTGTTTAAHTITANSVTTASAETISANGLTTGSALTVSSASIATTGGNSTAGVNINLSGANTNASATRYGLISNVAATGTTSNNVAGYFSATGATNNYGILVPNGNVGIGNSTPQALLDIAGPMRIAPTALPASPTAGLMVMDSGSSNTLKYYNGISWQSLTTGGGGSVGAGTQYGVAYYNTTTSTASTAVAGANNQVLTGMNAGAPVFSTATLTNTAMTFAGAGTLNTAAGNLAVQSASGGTTTLGASGGASGTVIQSGTGNILMNGGSVGVGTTAPDSPLTISQNTTGLPAPGSNSTNTVLHIAGADTAKARLLVEAFGNYPAVSLRMANGLAASGSQTMTTNGNVLGQFEAGGYDNTAYTGKTAYIQMTATEAWSSSTAHGTQMSFYTTANATAGPNSTPSLFLSNSGNVGIGTSSAPTQKLDVYGSIHMLPGLPGSATVGTIAIDTGSGNALSYYDGASWHSTAGSAFSGGSLASALAEISGSVSAPSYSFTGDTGTGVYDAAVGTLGFAASGTQAMKINATAVSIPIATASTSSSTGALVVSGGLGVGGAIYAGGAITTASTLSTGGTITNQLSSGSLYASSGTTSQYPSGGARLMASNQSSTDGSYSGITLGSKNAAGNSQFAFISNSSVNGAAQYSPALTFGLSNGTNAYQEYMRIDSTGQVGIGTTSPGAPLEVVASGGASSIANFTNSGNANTFIQIKNNSGAAAFGSSGNDLYLSAGGNERLRVASGGNVGVGNSNPAYKLDVAGDINVSGQFRVNGTPVGGGGSQWTTSGSNISYTAGAVGIGTSLPATRLDINGALTLEGMASGSAPPAATGTSVNLYYDTSFGLFLGEGGTYYNVITDDSVIWAATGSAASPAYAFYNDTTSGMYQPIAGALGFSVTGAEKMRLTNSGLGIGTVSPSFGLDVHSVSSPVIANFSGGSSGYWGAIQVQDPTAVTIGRIGWGGPGQMFSNALSAASSTLEIQGSYGVQIGGGSTAQLFLDTGGRVGIGTTAPAFLLDVMGPINVGSGSSYNLSGMKALGFIGTGTSANFYVGQNAFSIPPTGTYNAAIGSYTINGSALTGGYNTAVGVQALYNLGGNVSGTTAVGAQAGFYSTGAANTLIGAQAGMSLTSGISNTIIGSGSGSTTLTTGGSNIIIGQNLDTPTSTTSNTLNIGNSIFATGLYTAAMNIGIGTASPKVTLDVNGKIGSSATGTPSVSSCLGGTVTGNDTRGTINTGSTTSCMITFSSPYPNIPTCVVSPMSSMGTVTHFITTAAGSLTINLSLAGAKNFSYICMN
jgi:hypothetical protein